MKCHEILARNLKKHRHEYNISGEYLAYDCELSPRCFNDIENMKEIITFETLDKLCIGTGLSPDILLSEN